MAVDIIARGMITNYTAGTNINFTENTDGTVEISASGSVSSNDSVARDAINNHKSDTSNPHNVTPSQIGLDKVDNTSDADKPVSTAMQQELDKKAEKNHIHTISEISDMPSSLPANGGNADTVNGHTVNSDVPSNAVFTDTINSDVTAEGNPVTLDGLQGGVPFSKIVVSGKNLLPAMSNSVTRNGITYTVNADGTITLNGTAEKAGGVDVVYKMPLKAGVYTLSGCPEGGSGITFALRAGLGTANTLYGRDYGNGLKITTETDTVITVTIQNAEIGRVFDNVVFRPQLELGSTPTAYEPPITGRELTVNVSGKNLLPYPYADTTKTVNGITFTDNGDGTITANGTATANTTFKLSNNYMYKSGINYVVSGCPNGDGSAYKLKGNAEDVNADDVGNGKSFLFEKDTDCSICILIYRNATVDNLVFRPQLELGDTATPYEPYNGSVTTITPTSNPYTIPNDIRQVDRLNVVSVSEGELSVSGVRKNAAIKRIWDEIDEIKTAIIVSNGESE